MNSKLRRSLEYSEVLLEACIFSEMLQIVKQTLQCVNNDCTAWYPTANQCAVVLHVLKQLLDKGPFSLSGPSNLIFLDVTVVLL